MNSFYEKKKPPLDIVSYFSGPACSVINNEREREKSNDITFCQLLFPRVVSMSDKK